MDKRQVSKLDEDGDLFADGFAFGERKKRHPNAQLENCQAALERAQKRARMWEMSFLGLHRAQMRLVAMLVDLGVPADKLADWNKQLDHIEANKMDGKKNVTSVALDAATDDLAPHGD